MRELKRYLHVGRQPDVELGSSNAADDRFAPRDDVYAGFVLIGHQLPAEARLQFNLGGGGL